MSQRRQVTAAEILPLEDYNRKRPAKRREMVVLKARRRMEVGPFAMFNFENYDTMWYQIHEMLAIEKGAEAQLKEELAAYNPLIPNGRELVATVMFEFEDPVRRGRVLAHLGGVEHSAFLTVGGDRIVGQSEDDSERTRADGKASAVQFVHFPFSPAQIEVFRRSGAQIVLGFDHPNYRHMAVMPDDVRRELAADFEAPPA